VRFEVEVAGKFRTVEIEKTGKSYAVRVDGRPHAVDVARTGRSWSLLIGTRSYEIFVVNQAGAAQAGGAMVHVNGQPVAVSRSQSRGAGQAGVAGTAAHGPQRIVAPMPGRIIKLLVKVGDEVAARQGLVIVEAMKMENELRSPKAGTVTEVRVAEGMSVEANAVLVVVDEPVHIVVS
jgi:biotin carboxyl carrier protein